ncbi:MAG: hypothetical protein MJZ84_02580 [Paludibacteraceae bacterium]|nr:hypothetical protein [Paludibacteraceae bacterium]
MFSKKNLIVATQVIVLGVFVLLAAGSGSEQAAVATRAALGGLEGAECGSNGFYPVSSASSESECSSICAKKGYSAYCYGRGSNTCFCQ